MLVAEAAGLAKASAQARVIACSYAIDRMSRPTDRTARRHTGQPDRASASRTSKAAVSRGVAEFIAAQFIRVGVPDRYGGLGIEYDAMFEVGWELGRGCGAAAWCYSLWTVHEFLAGYWPVRGQEDLFANGPDTLISSSFGPFGKHAEPVDGGYRLSGRWEFSSGCDAAAWFELGATTPTGPVWMLVPRADVEIIDTWFVSGLAGSGSKDVAVKDAFIPLHRVLDPDKAGYGDWAGWEWHKQARYRVPLWCLIGWDLLSPLIGMVRGCVDEFIDRAKTRSGPSGRLKDAAPIQIRLRPGVKVKSVDLRINLEALSYHLKNVEDGVAVEEE